ncbi:MAG: hypothetical protein ACQXXH_08180 [Candidatus Bathyarchaeia archaeon]|nr:hypothetical protein [Candidatus Bathyarchaeota archaeon A05DMB-4]MDH7596025.1 hypothetical protein [Candidatus Bathyarchaeota archaeon]
MGLETVGKFFVHGVLFIVLFGVLVVGWVFLTFVLTSIGYLLGLAIGLGLLFLAMGYINKAVAGFLWGIESASSIWYHFFHGLILFLILAGLNFVFVLLPYYMIGDVVLRVVVVVWGVFWTGLLDVR